MILSSIVEKIWSDSRISLDYALALREICQPTAETSSHGNKMALLPMLFCEGYGGCRQQVVSIVTLWNLLRHAARLLDNFEDGHTPSPKQAATEINISTGLIFTASYILGELESHRVPAASASEIRHMFYATLLQVCGGQHEDLSRVPPTLERSWQIAGDKTGATLGLVCWAGTRIVCSDKYQLELCRQFGYSLGLLDQIQDDLTDLSASDDLYKTTHHNLSIAYAVTVLSSPQKDTLISLLKTVDPTPSDEELTRQLILESGAAVYLMAQSTLQREQARRLVEEMTVTHNTRNGLYELLDQFALV